MTDQVIIAVNEGINSVISFTPRLVGMLVIFLIGWLVAGICKKLTLQILKVIQLEPFADKVGLTRRLQDLGSTVTPVDLIADLIKWTVVIIFLTPAVEVLGLSQITVMMRGLLGYIPNIIVAVVIVMFGVIIADLTADFVRSGAAALASSTANVLAALSKYTVITFSILAALSQLKIAEQMVNTLFTGLVAMIAIAGGLAFGLGGKDLAAEILEAIKKSLTQKGNR
ncbi:hypothetical protein B5M47_01145 [candidate division CPR3 bacterium 4484_211]|uniref:Small-conductance mechanosensitive ion channel n=1 Tax=candidate division CPR3 bacterium 4484_211 TaxID=1968527 RepID=A0A1W9NYV2_UNCC3|nr:MAG: hypothetical protein B5M47_01145 [candidate division CPR3 bacterium 4484_211]